jgi:hypothetical protein
MVDSMSAEEADILVRLLRQVAESLSPEDAVAGAVSSS